MRMIDGDKLLARYKERCAGCKFTPNRCEHFCDIADVISDIEDAPTEDIVEVVRCKDCKWSEPYRTESGNVYLGCIELGISALIDSDYCSYGERKEKANEDSRR